ncbi:MAG: rod shape-determining protein MreC [Candidatus Saccharibacteria bacterium]
MNRNRANRRLVVTLGAGALLVVLGLLGRVGPVRWVYDHSLGPVGHSFAGAGSGMSEFFDNLGKVSHLAADNTKLEQENASLRQRLAADADTRRDNDILRRQLGFAVAGGTKQVGAEVIAFQPDSYRQFITINRGLNDGLTKGMAVTSDGILVGLVSEVSATSAKVALVTDPEFRLAVRDDETGAEGILSGQLGSGLIMDQISQTDSVKTGDSLTSAGLGGSVPRGLYIGQIQSVNTRQNAVFQSAQVITTLRANHLRFVFVVIGS